MKKEFKPGDYCRFPNEEIPRILDILRANGHKVWNDPAVVIEGDEAITCCNDGDIIATEYKFITRGTELSRHDFMVIALRLEVGMGILFDTTKGKERRHIHSEMIKIGLNAGIFSSSFGYVFTGKIWGGVRDKYITNPIPYLDWCKRLCVEPIGIEPTAEPVFDPSKPFEVRFDISTKWLKGKHYIGKEYYGDHVVQVEKSDGKPNIISIASEVRNIISFNASMLKVGEKMVVDDPNYSFAHNGNILIRTESGMLVNPDTGKEWSDLSMVKGRRVNVEIKVVETKTTKP